MLAQIARKTRYQPSWMILTLQRNLAAVIPTTIPPASAAITADARTLLSEANRETCINCMQSAPPMSKYLRHSKKPTQANRFAAVLICICIDEQGDASILYTRRSGQLRSHVRQISFPGGIKDPNDADFIDCALRETEEEIGLSRSRIEIWGTGTLIKPPETAAIMPVIGMVRGIFELDNLQLNEDEVEEAFTVPLAKLIDPTSLRYTQFKSGYSAPNFVVDGYKIWGITGFLTYRFLNCLLPKDLNRLKTRVRFVIPFKHN